VTIDTFLQNLLNALQWGSFYAIIAVGFSIVYGVLLLVNFAHGDIFMAGAYFAYFIGTLLLNKFEMQLPFALPGWAVLSITLTLTMALTALLAVSIERIAYRPLRQKGAHRLYVVITALMIGLFLEYANVATLGARDRPFPELVESVPFRIGAVYATNVKVGVIVISIAVMLLLALFVQRTKWGMAMRAISYDRLAVPLMGVSVDRIIVITFAIGGSMAALAGVLYGTAYPILKFNMGVLIGWKAFVSAVVGGIGSIRGAVVGGFLLGFLEIFVAAILPSTYRDLITFSLLLLILAVRPTGLFGVARRTKV
jgi:branched-chain amino acid transport system permease protein